MSEKIYKPPICEQCPVCRVDKNKIKCGVSHDLEAGRFDTKAKAEMWRKCPIDWDKKGENNAN